MPSGILQGWCHAVSRRTRDKDLPNVALLVREPRSHQADQQLPLRLSLERGLGAIEDLEVDGREAIDDGDYRVTWGHLRLHVLCWHVDAVVQAVARRCMHDDVVT